MVTANYDLRYENEFATSQIKLETKHFSKLSYHCVIQEVRSPLPIWIYAQMLFAIQIVNKYYVLRLQVWIDSMYSCIRLYMTR